MAPTPLAIQALIAADPTLGMPLDAALPYVAAEVIWAAREEMACTVEDILARRTRALFLHAAAAIRMAPALRNCSRKNSAMARLGRRSKSPPSPHSPAAFRLPPEQCRHPALASIPP